MAPFRCIDSSFEGCVAIIPAMAWDNLSEEERAIVLELISETVNEDRFPLSHRICALKSALAKLDPIAAPQPWGADMRCRFRVYGDGRLLAEHDGEVLDKDDTQTINRIEQTALTKGRAAAGPAPIRDFRVEGPEFF